MNQKLAALLEWADAFGIDLSKTQITFDTTRWEGLKEFKVSTVVFYHDKETRANILALKRAAPLVAKGKAPYVDLVCALDYESETHGPVSLYIKYEGAFECKVSHDCKPKGWSEEQLKGSTLPFEYEDVEEAVEAVEVSTD